MPKLVSVLCLLLLLCLAVGQVSVASSKGGRVTCKNYSCALPEGFESRYYLDDSAKFDSAMAINMPFDPKEDLGPTIHCIQIRKNGPSPEHILPFKERLGFLVAPRQDRALQITATENVTRGSLNFKFNLLEEKPGSSREIREHYLYIPVIEINAKDDEYHTIIFIIDDAQGTGAFINMDARRSTLTNIANTLMNSIRRTRP